VATEPSLAGLHDRRNLNRTQQTRRPNSLLHYLIWQIGPKIGQEAAVDIFAVEYLRGLSPRGRVVDRIQLSYLKISKRPGYDDENGIVSSRYVSTFL